MAILLLELNINCTKSRLLHFALQRQYIDFHLSYGYPPSAFPMACLRAWSIATMSAINYASQHPGKAFW